MTHPERLRVAREAFEAGQVNLDELGIKLQVKSQEHLALIIQMAKGIQIRRPLIRSRDLNGIGGSAINWGKQCS